MSLRCFFGLHRPSLSSIAQRAEGFSALCERCTLPLERRLEGRWTVSQPLAQRADKDS